MPFSDLVAAARKAPGINFQAKANTVTDSSAQEKPLAEKHVSINAIAQQLRGERLSAMSGAKPENERHWQNCKFLQKTSSFNACTQFATKCAEERCPKKYMQ